MKSGERRDFLRIDLEGGVRIKSVDGAPRSIKGMLFNISYKGFSVYAKEKIELGSALEMEMDSPLLGHPLACKGKAIHLREPQPGRTFFKIGIAFTEVNHDAVTYLLKRQEFILAEQGRKKRGDKPMDFCPY